MAEKYKIFEAEIDTMSATESVRALKSTLSNLREEANKVRDEQGELSDEYIEYQAAIKVTTDELRRQETVTKAVIKAQNTQEGSIEQTKAQLILVTAEWEKLSEAERENTEQGKALSASKLQLTEKLKGLEKATGDNRRNVGNYTEGMKQATEGVAEFVPGAGKASAAAKSLGGAFKLMLGPVGIIIAVIAGVVQAIRSFFESSEEGQNKLAMFTAAFSGAFGVINDLLSDFGEMIIAAFENPKQAIADLWETIKTNIINRFEGLIDTFKAVGKVLKGVFTLDWDMIKEGSSEFGESFIQSVTGVDNLVGKVVNGVKKLGAEIDDKARKAMKLAELQASLDKQIRNATVQNAKDMARVAKLREEIAAKDNKTSAERLKLLDEAIAIENEIENRNVAIARQKYEIKKAQNALAKSNKDALNEEANLLAGVYAAENAAAMRRKEMTAQRAEIVAKEMATQRELAEASVGLMEHELNMYKLSLDKRQGLTAEGVAKELEIKRKGLEIKIAEIDATENISDELKQARKIALEKAFIEEQTRLNIEFNEQERARALEVAEMNYQNELANAQRNIFGKLDLEREGLQMKMQQELEYADLIGADRQLILDKYAQQEIELERLKQDAKLGLAQSFAGNLATIFGQGTKLGKAAAAAETVINTYKAAQAAYASMAGIPIVGPALGAVAAIAAVKMGYDNLKKIYAVNTNPKSGGANSVSASTATTQATQQMPRGQAVIPQAGASIAGQAVGVPIGGQEGQSKVLVVEDVTFKQNRAAQIERLGTLS